MLWDQKDENGFTKSLLELKSAEVQEWSIFHGSFTCIYVICVAEGLGNDLIISLHYL